MHRLYLPLPGGDRDVTVFPDAIAGRPHGWVPGHGTTCKTISLDLRETCLFFEQTNLFSRAQLLQLASPD